METGFTGYAARYCINSDLEKITYVSKPNSFDKLIGNNHYSVNLYTLYSVLLFLSLSTLPMFTIILISITYIEFTKKSDPSNPSDPTDTWTLLSIPSSLTDPDPSDRPFSDPTNTLKLAAASHDQTDPLTLAAASHDQTDPLTLAATSCGQTDTSVSCNTTDQLVLDFHVITNTPNLLSTQADVPDSVSSSDHDPSNKSGSESINLKYMMYGVGITCIPVSGAMIYLQFSIATGKYEVFYVYPYLFLWMLSIVYFFISGVIVSRVERARNYERLTKCKYKWVEIMLLWFFTTTMQLLSWHLVFVVCGFILNPLRALLYCTIIIVSVVCCVVLVAIIIKLLCILKNRTLNIDMAAMFSLILLLACAYAYIVFVFQISITVNKQTVEGIAKSIIPYAFMTIIAWLLPKMFLDPEKLFKYIKKNGAFGARSDV